MKNKWFVLILFAVLGLFTMAVVTDGYSDDDDDDRWGYESDDDHHDGEDDDDDDDYQNNRPRERRNPRAGLRSMDPVTNTAWKDECGSCHLAFHPGLLPARSWETMMGGLNDHFGTNASLDSATRQAITDFLIANAADQGLTRRANSIARSIPKDAAPLRITETYFFKRKHDEIRSEVWTRERVVSKANCAACHELAEKGFFHEDSVKIPALKRR